MNGVWYASQKCLWTKIQGNDQNFLIIPRIYVHCAVRNSLSSFNVLSPSSASQLFFKYKAGRSDEYIGCVRLGSNLLP